MSPGDLCHLLPKMSSKTDCVGRQAGMLSEVGASTLKGWLGDKLFSCLRVKAAASPLFGGRRVESQELICSTPKFTWKRAKPV